MHISECYSFRMIIVVEGISASGKSSWCAKHASRHIVHENGRLNTVPDRRHDPAAAATFWAKRNSKRWHAALANESQNTLAVCDTDPLKLHYVWCLWRIGEAKESNWRLELAATRNMIAKRQIGFADCYLVQSIDPQLARQHARADDSRRRRNFELHVRLQPALIEWYRALEVVLPGRVQFGLPPSLPEMEAMGQRYDLEAFDRMIEALDYG